MMFSAVKKQQIVSYIFIQNSPYVVFMLCLGSTRKQKFITWAF